MADAKNRGLERHYQTNVPTRLICLRRLYCPSYGGRRGQVVLVNSSAGLIAKAGVGQYSATKHALKAVADSLREEVDREGIRVLSIFPGRTATPTQILSH